MTAKSLTQSRLKELLHYNPDTGIFTWIIDSRGPIRKGRIAGTPQSSHYISITVDNYRTLAHRLAFLYMTGAMPPNDTDHINGVRHDNRWDNLRCVTRSENLRNQKQRLDNTSGITGVAWANHRRKWRAHIMVKQQFIHLGYFTNLADAIKARNDAELFHKFSPTHGRITCPAGWIPAKAP